MITIEELKRLDADNFGIELSGIELLHTGIPVQELVRFALSQHEEIESLKTILREAEHLASAEKGNLCARIIHMKDEIERLRADLTAANDNHEHRVEEWKAAMREIERLQEEVERLRAALEKNSWAEGFRKGQESIKRKNESGCCCKIDEDGETIESACMMHIEWRDEAYERAAQTCEVEAIDLEYSEHREVDFPYNQAVKDCAMAIRALKSGGPK